MTGKPNIFLLTADSLRADRLGCYSSRRAPSLTPNIDALARRSLRFTHAYAQGPYTTFSLPAIFTGKYPCRLEPMRWALRPNQRAGALVDGTTTFVEVLQRAGYHTAAFHSNPLVSRLFGFHKGFDVFYDDVLLSDSTIPEKLRLAIARAQRIFRVDPFMGAHALNAKVLDWLATAPEPFFLWVHYMDTHGPYLAKKVLRSISPGERLWRKSTSDGKKITAREQERLVRNYHRQISALDGELGRLWRACEERNLFDRSLLVFSADHGDEFFEHGGYSHMHKLYDELLHVPLIVRQPGTVPGAVPKLTELIQIAPTILQCAGVPGAEAAHFDAESFLPVSRPPAKSPSKDWILAEAGNNAHDAICIRTPEWKLIWKDRGREKELYNLIGDPLEQTNVAQNRPETLRALEAKVAAHLNGASCTKAAAAAVAPVEVTKAEEHLVLERLRDLGYL